MKLLDNLNKTNSIMDKRLKLRGIGHLDWKTFVYAYSPYMVYHMKFRDEEIHDIGREPNEEMFKLLDDILDKTISGNKAKAMVRTYAANHGDLIKLIINKDLRCGVTATTFNKVHPQSIAQFKVQLAKEAPLDSLKYPLIVQLKYDGVRIVAINRDGKVKFFTRNGKLVNLPELRRIVESIPAVNFILDGELTLTMGGQEDRTTISGMVNSAMHGGSISELNTMFNCFDFMSLQQWEDMKCEDTYDVRFSLLKEVVNQIQTDNMRVAQTFEAHSPEGVSEIYEGVIAAGFEGLILKQADHLYTFKRTKDWVKIKEIITSDLKCINILGGEGKYQGMIGALKCQGTVDGKEVTVKVGSGLTDIQRGLPESEFMFRTIEVKHNGVIQDKATGKYSLFLPRFVMVRFDK